VSFQHHQFGGGLNLIYAQALGKQTTLTGVLHTHLDADTEYGSPSGMLFTKKRSMQIMDRY
jgi:hypothetical protein